MQIKKIIVLIEEAIEDLFPTYAFLQEDMRTAYLEIKETDELFRESMMDIYYNKRNEFMKVKDKMDRLQEDLKEYKQEV